MKKERGKPHLPLPFDPSERGIMQPMSNMTAKAVSRKLLALIRKAFPARFPRHPIFL
jgi:hypothetical protein